MCSKKKAVLKNFSVFTGKQLFWSLFLVKLQLLVFKPTTLLKRDSNTGVFLCILHIFICELISGSISNLYAKFWNLRTAASDYSFISVIYLFSAVSLQLWRNKPRPQDALGTRLMKKNYDILWWGKCSLKLDYVIQ